MYIPSQYRNLILICLARLAALVQEARLSEGELKELCTELSDVYVKHVERPETETDIDES
jgi:hypothetical protein